MIGQNLLLQLFFQVAVQDTNWPLISLTAFSTSPFAASYPTRVSLEVVSTCGGNGWCSVRFRCAVANRPIRYRAGTAFVTHVRKISTTIDRS